MLQVKKSYTWLQFIFIMMRLCVLVHFVPTQKQDPGAPNGLAASP